MFRKFSPFGVKIAIVFFIILILIVLGYFLFFAKENKFDILSIQQTLTSGNKALFKTDIIWSEKDGSLIGNLNIDSLQSKVTYILQEYSIESIVFLDDVQEVKNNIPCLNIIHLLSKTEVKNIFERLFEDGKVPKEAYQIPVNSKIFIDYYQTNSAKGLELHCKMYYMK